MLRKILITCGVIGNQMSLCAGIGTMMSLMESDAALQLSDTL